MSAIEEEIRAWLLDEGVCVCGTETAEHADGCPAAKEGGQEDG